MKKLMISVFLLLTVILAVSCLDYKAYDVPKDNVDEEVGLIDEIAAIEAELGLDDDEVVGDVILPDLDNEEIISAEQQTINVKENQLVTLNVDVSDPDDDVVTYTYSPPFDDNGEWQTNYGDAGDYLVTIVATDQVHTVEKKVKVSVQRVNVPPVLEGVRDLIADEGDVVEFEPQVSDPNGDAVTLTVTGPLKDGPFVTDHTSSGEYQIRVIASDGELETEKSFLLTVNDINVKPEVTNLPEKIIISEGETVTLEPSVLDIDGDKVTISISNPVGDDGVWQTGFTDHGEYNIVVTVSDGKDIVTVQVPLTVKDINMPPEIVDVFVNTE